MVMVRLGVLESWFRDILRPSVQCLGLVLQPLSLGLSLEQMSLESKSGYGYSYVCLWVC